MKKAISLLMITLTLFWLCGCKKEETQNITELNGVWTVSYATYNDRSIKLKYDTNISIYFKNGVCKINDGTQIITGNYQVKDNTVTYTINNISYKMTSPNGGTTMVFTEKTDNNTLSVYYTRTSNIDEDDWKENTNSENN